MTKNILISIVAALVLVAIQLSCTSQTSFSDPQGNSYGMVVIGQQIWMTDNLQYDVGEGSFCYDNDPAMCSEMGRLYTWEAAKKAASEILGWHLPSREEWKELIAYCGPDSSSAYFNLIADSTGFNPQPSGVRVAKGEYKARGLGTANYWSASIADTSEVLAYSVAIMANFEMISPHNYPVDNACSVRLIKDR